MKISMMAACLALSLSAIKAKQSWIAPACVNQITPPNARNDNAAQRKRAAKKNRNAKRRGKK